MLSRAATNVGFSQDETTTCDAEPTDMTIVYGNVIGCSINPIGDSDLFRFSGMAGESVVLQITDANVNREIRARLIDQNNNTIVNPFEGRTDVTLPTTGLYTIEVSEAGNDETTGYVLTLERIIPVSPTALPICTGCTLNDNNNLVINPVGDMDIFSFDFSGGSSDITLTITDGNVNREIRMELHAPDGTIIGGPVEGSINVTLTEPGTYIILVYEAGLDETTGYNLTLQCITGSCPTTKSSVITLGLSTNGRGWMEVVDGSPPHNNKAWIQVPWGAYNQANGETRPVMCDLDGDGLDEIVVGLGSYPGSDRGCWLEIRDDMMTGYAHLDWIRSGWAAYCSSNGETIPDCYDVDMDNKAEIIIGLGQGSGGLVRS